VCVVKNGNAACVEGECAVDSCDVGFANCDADPSLCETKTDTALNCGACNTPCSDLPHAIATCASGSCSVLNCESGWADCDKRADNGCEVDLSTKSDCGACDVTCTKASCAGGICTAIDCGTTGMADCDADGATCEVDLKSDAKNCGRCGNACAFNSGVSGHGTLTCSATGCGVTCDSGYIDCDGDYRTGCDVLVDTDKDSYADCKESCPTDPNKQAPGQCGCGTPDTDSDGDGVADCKDACPKDRTKTGQCLTFAPANFDPRSINWSTQPSTTLNCGTTTINTTDPDGSGSQVVTFGNWCGTAPSPIVQSQSGGPDIVIIPLHGFTLASGNTLRVTGSRPLIIAVDSGATINGTIDASASDITPGAGGNWSCGGSQGGNGSGSTARFGGASGGGGGGFASAGGSAGTADTDSSKSAGGGGGSTRGSNTLIPLYGGCAGGQAGDCSTPGAAGGGALQISAGGVLDVNGTVRANGGNGATPCGASDEGGGTGGGSGGAILFEGVSVDTSGATVQVNGGSGGRNGSYAGIYNCGDSNGGSGSTGASSSGGSGTSCQGGSSGGGGGYGRIRTVTH
jgi:hypothetical protein